MGFCYFAGRTGLLTEVFMKFTSECLLARSACTVMTGVCGRLCVLSFDYFFIGDVSRMRNDWINRKDALNSKFQVLLQR